MIGKQILHYKILQELGRGGMGVVYKAEDTKLKRDVAIKFLPRQIAASEEERARFKIEAQAAAALNHPNIAHIYAIEEVDDEMFMVMEYIEGEELKKKVDSDQLSVNSVIDIAVQIASGLQAAHAKDITHRDIKSSNIMVTKSGQIKIMDFGLAKIAGQQTQLTKTGTTVGTVAYMSPEQARGEAVDHRADIWSFGVVLYEMLAGQLPFRGEYEAAMMYSILNEEPEPITTLRPEVSSDLAALVSRCLEKDIARRCNSIREIVETLRSFSSQGRQTAGLQHGVVARVFRKPIVLVPLLLVIVTAVAITYSFISRTQRVNWARERAIPEIEKLAAEDKWSAVYTLIRSVEEIIPTDPAFVKIKEWYARTVSIKSDPAGARVLWREYADSSEGWHALGETPLNSIIFARGNSLLKLEKEGYEPFEGPISDWEINMTMFRLAPAGTVPAGMIWVPGGTYALSVPGLEQIDSVTISDYFIDRYEVTNKQFKDFVDAGAYLNPKFWKYPFMRQGRELGWKQAMAEFRDATGRNGPATWELGTYPEGQAEHPVAGVSWYEAAAYAEFAGKSLPTVFHWNVVAGTEFSSDIVPHSNFSGKGAAVVGAFRGINRFGAFDMAGNVREWCWNESGAKKFILGGGWNDLTYMFNDAYTQDPFDRSPTNGFRCIKYSGAEPNRQVLTRSIDATVRDLRNDHPVSDETFRYYRSLFDYDKSTLHAAIEFTDSASTHWTVQKMSFKAAYGNERMNAYLFLPRAIPAPYQVVLFFPGSDAIYSRESDPAVLPKDFDFILKSGRAVFFPIYKSTYERGDDLKSDDVNMTITYKDHVIMWVKDFSRSIDYLETRSDCDCSRLGYFGVSWGGAMGAIVPAVETRLKAVVLFVAGLSRGRSLPDVDALNYVTRVKAPVLMLNGKYDHFFPYETAIKPMFDLLGTPTQHKRNILYETGHTVPRNQLIKETLDWFDLYLGRVR